MPETRTFGIGFCCSRCWDLVLLSAGKWVLAVGFRPDIIHGRNNDLLQQIDWGANMKIVTVKAPVILRGVLKLIFGFK